MHRMTDQQLTDIEIVIENGKSETYRRQVRKNADSLCCTVDAADSVNARLGLSGEFGVEVSPYVRRSLQVLKDESARFAAAA